MYLFFNQYKSLFIFIFKSKYKQNHCFISLFLISTNNNPANIKIEPIIPIALGDYPYLTKLIMQPSITVLKFVIVRLPVFLLKYKPPIYKIVDIAKNPPIIIISYEN